MPRNDRELGQGAPGRDLSRRQFLAHSAGIAGASWGLGTHPAARAGAAEKGEPSAIRVGYIGLGDRGRELLGAALDCPAVTVAALCDLDPRRLRRGIDMAGAQRPRAFNNYRALLDDRGVDAVIIATPVDQHASQTLTALAAGKHVYCEKPMALDLSQASEVLAACRAAALRGQVYQAGLQRRYSPRYAASLTFLRGGELGQPLFVRAQWHAVAPPGAAKPWLHVPARSGGIVLEQATHQLDVFNWVFGGLPAQACGLGGSLRGRGAVAGEKRAQALDHYGVEIEYPGGGKVHFSHLDFAVPERRFSGIYELVFCERGGIDLANALAWDRSGKARELAKDSGADTGRAIDAFAAAAGAGLEPAAGAEVAYAAMLAAVLVREAVERGGRVTLAEFESA